MTATLIIAMAIAPIVVVPVVLIWYIAIGGMVHVAREAMAGAGKREEQ